MIFGSFLANAGRIILETADNKKAQVNNSQLERAALRIFGIPHIGIRLRSNIIIRKIRKSRPKNILDAGCGPGYLSMFLKKEGFDIIGIDNSRNKIDNAKSISKKLKLNSRFLLGDITKTDFKDSSFDFIICSEVIEHIKKDKEALIELTRVLKKNGTIIITVPANNKFAEDFREKYKHERAGYNKEDIIKKMPKENKLVDSLALFSFFGKIAWRLNMGLIGNKYLATLSFYPLYFISFLDILLNLNDNPLFYIYEFRKVS